MPPCVEDAVSEPSAPASAGCVPRDVDLANGLRLEYVESGEPAGLPVLFVHGTSDSWRSFEPVLPFLPPSLRVLAVSLRGHGRSSRPDAGYGERDFADDLALFLDAVQAPAAVIVGHSMGSVIAQRFAIDHPHRTLALGLLGAGPTFRGKPAIADLWDVVSTLTDPVDPAFVRAFQESTIARPVPCALLDAAVGESLLVPARVWRAMVGALREDDHTEELERIEAPTLQIWGDRDAIFTQTDQVALHCAIRRSESIVHAGGGHAVHWEAPARVAEELKAFISWRVGPLWA